MHAIFFLSSLHPPPFFIIKTKHPPICQSWSVHFVQNCLTLTGLRPVRKYKVQSHRPWLARESLTPGLSLFLSNFFSREKGALHVTGKPMTGPAILKQASF